MQLRNCKIRQLLIKLCDEIMNVPCIVTEGLTSSEWCPRCWNEALSVGKTPRCTRYQLRNCKLGNNLINYMIRNTVQRDRGPTIVPLWNEALGVGMRPSVLERHLGVPTHNTQYTTHTRPHMTLWESHSKTKDICMENNKVQSDVVKQPQKQIKSNIVHVCIYE